MKLINPKDVAAVLAVTDALGIHREAVRVPLAPRPGGSVTVERGALIVELPEKDVEAFLGGLAERVRSLPGAGALKRVEP